MEMHFLPITNLMWGCSDVTFLSGFDFLCLRSAPSVNISGYNDFLVIFLVQAYYIPNFVILSVIKVKREHAGISVLTCYNVIFPDHW